MKIQTLAASLFLLGVGGALLAVPHQAFGQSAGAEKAMALPTGDYTEMETFVQRLYAKLNPMSREEVSRLLQSEDDLKDFFTADYRQRLRRRVKVAAMNKAQFMLPGHERMDKVTYELNKQPTAVQANSVTVHLAALYDDDASNCSVVFQRTEGGWRINDMRILGNG